MPLKKIKKSSENQSISGHGSAAQARISYPLASYSGLMCSRTILKESETGILLFSNYCQNNGPNWSAFMSFQTWSDYCFGSIPIKSSDDLNHLVSCSRTICPLPISKKFESLNPYRIRVQVNFHEITYKEKKHRTTTKRSRHLSTKMHSKCIENSTKMFRKSRSIVQYRFQNGR